MVSPRHVRWFALLFFVFIVLVLLHRRNIEVLPSPSRFPQAQTSCPAIPPSPSLIVSARKGFDWSSIKTHYPVQKVVSIPQRSRKNGEWPRIQHDFRNSEEQELEAAPPSILATLVGGAQAGWARQGPAVTPPETRLTSKRRKRNARLCSAFVPSNDG